MEPEHAKALGEARQQIEARGSIALLPERDVSTLADAGPSSTETLTNAYAMRVTSSSGTPPVTVTRYADSAGRLTQAEPPPITQASGVLAQHPLTVSYWPDSDLARKGLVQRITRGQREVTFEYAARKLTSATWPEGGSALFAYGTSGRLESVTSAGRTVSAVARPNDSAEDVVVPPGTVDRTHTFTDNADGALACYTPPASAGPNAPTGYLYNADGQLTHVTAACTTEGAVAAAPLRLSAHYAALTGRLDAIQDAVSAESVSVEQYTSGRLKRVAARDVSIALKYDGPNGEGALLWQTAWQWTQPVTAPVVLARAHDDYWRVTSMSVGPASAGFAYDGASRLSTAGLLSLNRCPTSGVVLGSTLATGGASVVDTRRYNAYGEVDETVSARFAGGTTPLYQETITARDGLGRVTAKTEVTEGVARSWVYTYDPQGRLATATKDGVVVGQYGYDANGNRLRVMNGPDIASYDAQDRIIAHGDTTYEHDAHGSRTAKHELSGSTTYVYDARGALRSVTLPSGQVVTYEIDGFGRRVGRRVDGGVTHRWVYMDTLRPVAELDATGNVRSLFVYANGSNVPAYVERDGVVYRIVTDRLGSVRLVVNVATGEIAQRMDYDIADSTLATDSSPESRREGSSPRGRARMPVSRLLFQASRWNSATWAPIAFVEELADRRLLWLALQVRLPRVPRNPEDVVGAVLVWSFGVRDGLGLRSLSAGRQSFASKPSIALDCSAALLFALGGGDETSVAPGGTGHPPRRYCPHAFLQSASIWSALTARIPLRALHSSMHVLPQVARHSFSMASMDMAFIWLRVRHWLTHKLALVASSAGLTAAITGPAAEAAVLALGWHAETASAAAAAARVIQSFMRLLLECDRGLPRT